MFSYLKDTWTERSTNSLGTLLVNRIHSMLVDDLAIDTTSAHGGGSLPDMCLKSTVEHGDSLDFCSEPSLWWNNIITERTWI